MPTVDTIKARLHIGSFSPQMFDQGEYTRCNSQQCETEPGVEAFLKSPGHKFDAETIFQITLNGKLRYFANKQSYVSIGAFRFRNPVQFLDFNDPTVVQAEDETDATLEHYFFHPNTAPFLCRQFIQRFVTSNPSPSYIKAVSEAFISGSYEGLGTGQYGDLKATFAAILLHREARTPVLDHDPTHGRLREPVIKLLHVLRAMEFESSHGWYDVHAHRLSTSIGQQYLYQVTSPHTSCRSL